MFAHADFYTLAPVADESTGTVKARWEALQVTPQHPDFMRARACGLVEAMKDLITKNFSLRDIEYQQPFATGGFGSGWHIAGHPVNWRC